MRSSDAWPGNPAVWLPPRPFTALKRVCNSLEVQARQHCIMIRQGSQSPPNLGWDRSHWASVASPVQRCAHPPGTACRDPSILTNDGRCTIMASGRPRGARAIYAEDRMTDSFRLDEWPHRRYNPLTGEWVLVRCQRATTGRGEPAADNALDLTIPREQSGPAQAKSHMSPNSSEKCPGQWT